LEEELPLLEELTATDELELWTMEEELPLLGLEPLGQLLLN
jgi:hypothetical protein